MGSLRKLSSNDISPIIAPYGSNFTCRLWTTRSRGNSALFLGELPTMRFHLTEAAFNDPACLKIQAEFTDDDREFIETKKFSQGWDTIAFIITSYVYSSIYKDWPIEKKRALSLAPATSLKFPSRYIDQNWIKYQHFRDGDVVLHFNSPAGAIEYTKKFKDEASRWEASFRSYAEEKIAQRELAAQEQRRLFETPNQIDPKDWYSHALLLAQPGAGKTNAIRWRIVQLIPQIREGRASLIVLDPKGVLTHEMLTLARAQGLEKRTVFIDPERAPVSVNLFANDGTVNETIARISRVFATISTDLTAIQRDTLTFCLRALFASSNSPSLAELRRILRQGKAAIQMDALPEVVHEFFEFDFKEADGTFILRRLNSFLSNPIFETLFSAESSFDIGKEMQAGKLIVINAGNTEALYGRFWIEEIARTIRPRIALQGRQLPTTLIIDEAPTFIAEDRHFAEILDQARQALIGLFIAAQHMGQITDDHVKQSLYNCVLKFVARTNADIHNLCRSMGMTEPEFLGTTPQYQFAFFGPDMDTAVRVKLPLVEFARARREDIDFFSRRASASPPPEEEPEEERQPSIDDLGLADAYHQLAIAIRRGNTQRAAELQEYIDSYLKRQQPGGGFNTEWKG